MQGWRIEGTKRKDRDAMTEHKIAKKVQTVGGKREQRGGLGVDPRGSKEGRGNGAAGLKSKRMLFGRKAGKKKKKKKIPRKRKDQGEDSKMKNGRIGAEKPLKASATTGYLTDEQY